MRLSNVVNMKYSVYYDTNFVSELGRVLDENTRGNRGTSERITQVGLWIRNLLVFIQRLGNLSDVDKYNAYGDYLGFDTNLFDNGIGEIYFNIFYDRKSNRYIIFILDVEWDFSSNYLYNLMTENKFNEILKKIIREVVREALLFNKNRLLF